MVLQHRGSSLHIFGIITGLDPNSQGGWHIHTGFTCDDATAVGGHYYDPNGEDDWIPIKWRSDSKGVAVVSEEMLMYTLTKEGMHPVLGRAIVVHDSDSQAEGGETLGCGLIQPSMAQVALIKGYETYDGIQKVSGIITVNDTATGVHRRRAHRPRLRPDDAHPRQLWHPHPQRLFVRRARGHQGPLLAAARAGGPSAGRLRV